MADLLHASFDGANGATSFTGADGRVWTGASGGALSTSPVKYGTAAAATAGNFGGSRLTAGGPTINIGTGDFTIEFWAYASTLPADTLVAFSTLANSAQSGIALGVNGNGSAWVKHMAAGDTTFSTSSNSTNVGLGSAPSTGVWNHYAVSRQSGTLRTFFNGTLANSVAWNFSYSFTAFVVGKARADGSSGDIGWNGRVDDLRISDTARYTASFTPTGPNSYTPPWPGSNVLTSVATLTAALPVGKVLAATPTGSAAVTQAVLQGSVPLGAQPTGLATLTPGIAQQTRLAGAGQGVAAVTADLTSVFLVDLASAPVAQATTTAALQTLPLLVAQPAVTSSATAELSLVVPLDVQAINTAMVSAPLALDKPLAAAGAAVATSMAPLLKRATLQAGGSCDAQAQAQVLLAYNLATDAISHANAAAAMTLQVFMALLAQSRAAASAAAQVGIDPAFDVWTRYVVIAADAPGTDNDRLVLVPADLRGVLVEASVYTALVPPGPADAAMPSEAITA